MASSPKVSIITVVFNGQRHLRQAMDSVFAQDYPNLEYIVIDGGSTDGTLDIIRENESRIDRWISEPDRGIYDAMNKGLRYATGDYVIFLNSDDYFIGQISEMVEQIVVDHGCADIYYGNTIIIAEGYQHVLRKRNLDRCDRPVTFNHPSTFTSISLLRKMNGFDERYRCSGDYDFFVRAVKFNSLARYVNINMTLMRSGGVSDSISTLIPRVREHYAIDREHFSLYYRIVLFVSFGVIGAFKFIVKKGLIKYGCVKVVKAFYLWRR